MFKIQIDLSKHTMIFPEAVLRDTLREIADRIDSGELSECEQLDGSLSMPIIWPGQVHVGNVTVDAEDLLGD